jgi:hypothetical protein
MRFFWEIGLQSIEILTLIFGILGMTVSLLLLYSPSVVRDLSAVFNRSVDLDRKISFLDRSISTDKLIYEHPVLFGVFMALGSAFALVFFFFKLDVAHFSRVVFASSGSNVGAEMFFDFLAMLGKIACVFGFGLGCVLAMAPKRIRRLESKLNSWFETGPLMEKLEKPRHGFDTFLFRHSRFFGFLGAAVSGLLIVLSVLNLLR